MTNEQITSELITDYNILQQTCIPQLMKSYDMERKHTKPDCQAAWARQYVVKSPKQANTWMVVLQKPVDRTMYTGIEDVVGCAFTWYNGSLGLRAFRPSATLIEVFNPHFFTRYNERMNLNLHDMTDVMKCFFLNSGYFQPEKVREGRSEYIMSVCRGGAALGEFLNVQPRRWLVHKTFITHTQMRESQASGQLQVFKTTNESFALPASSAGKVVSPARKKKSVTPTRNVKLERYKLQQQKLEQLLASA